MEPYRRKLWYHPRMKQNVYIHEYLAWLQTRTARELAQEHRRMHGVFPAWEWSYNLPEQLTRVHPTIGRDMKPPRARHARVQRTLWRKVYLSLLLTVRQQQTLALMRQEQRAADRAAGITNSRFLQ